MLLTNFLTIHLLLNLLLTSLFYFYSVFSSAFLYVFGGKAHAVGTKLRLQTSRRFTRSMPHCLLILQPYLITIQATVFHHTLAAAGCVHHIFTFAPAVSGSLSIIYGIAISAICARVGGIALLLASRSSYLLIVAMTKSIAVFRFVA